jgi:hypothetical protein
LACELRYIADIANMSSSERSNQMNRRTAAITMAGGSLALIKGLNAQPGVGAAGRAVSSSLRMFLSAPNNVSGTFDIVRFANVNNALNAIGTLTVTNGTRTAVTTLALPVVASTLVSAQQLQTECPILHLEIGPINIDLLGLVINIPNPIVIDIVAVPGPGNLLGNLLCAIAGLLDPGGTLQNILNQLVALLNKLLAAL